MAAQALASPPSSRVIVPLAGAEESDLRRRVERLQAAVAGSAEDEPLAPFAAAAAAEPSPGPWRAAAIAGGIRELEGGLARISTWLETPSESPPARAAAGAVLVRPGEGRPRIGILFPGQGSPVHTDAGALGELIPEAATGSSTAELEASDGVVSARAVQPAVVASSLCALRAVRAVGIEPSFALGHSLGELVALCWGGALTESALRDLARARGQAMTAPASGHGAMASILGGADAFGSLVRGRSVALACENSPLHRVVSGELGAVEECVAEARRRGLRATRLRVSGAFHSDLMAAAIPDFRRALEAAPVRPLTRPVLSTVTGGWLDAGTDLRGLLARQLTAPVRFLDAIRRAASCADLMIEAGPGRALTALSGECADLPCVPVEAGSGSDAGALRLIALAWACGAAPGAGAHGVGP